MFNQEEKNPLASPQTMPKWPVEIEKREVKAEKPPADSYWWHAPWGAVIRVTKSQRMRLMEQWLESGR